MGISRSFIHLEGDGRAVSLCAALVAFTQDEGEEKGQDSKSSNNAS